MQIVLGRRGGGSDYRSRRDRWAWLGRSCWRWNGRPPEHLPRAWWSGQGRKRRGSPRTSSEPPRPTGWASKRRPRMTSSSPLAMPCKRAGLRSPSPSSSGGFAGAAVEGGWEFGSRSGKRSPPCPQHCNRTICDGHDRRAWSNWLRVPTYFRLAVNWMKTSFFTG